MSVGGAEQVETGGVGSEVEHVGAGREGHRGDDAAVGAINGKLCFVWRLHGEGVVGGIGIKSQIPAEGTLVNAGAGDVVGEEIVDHGQVLHVVLVIFVPFVLATLHVDKAYACKVGAVLVGIEREGHAIIHGIGVGVCFGIRAALVGIAPETDGFVHAEAQVHFARHRDGFSRTIGVDEIVVGAMDVEDVEMVCRGGVSKAVGNQAAGCRNTFDAVGVFNAHAVGHERSHGKSREKQTVRVECVGRPEIVNQRHQKAGVIHVAVRGERHPHYGHNNAGIPCVSET